MPIDQDVLAVTGLFASVRADAHSRFHDQNRFLPMTLHNRNMRNELRRFFSGVSPLIQQDDR
ncbi:MAG: hypothetical protein R3C59_14875 [Planctomycetaceae bacterium]